MILKNAMVYTKEFKKERLDLQIQGEKITALGSTQPDKDVLDCTGCILTPGFIDIHIHGCAGADFCDGTHQAIQTISRYLAKQGVTSFCGTSMTIGHDDLLKIFANADAMAGQEEGAYLQGINMEGPFLSPAKKGAQAEEYIRPGSMREFTELFEISGRRIKLVDVAPEMPGNLDFIKEASKMATVSLAHTNATYAQAVDGFEAGATHVTHLFNAMSPFTHRAPGVAGAALENKNATCELICDGFHIHPAALRIAFQAMGPNRPVVVSDSMKATGLADGEYELGGQPVFVKEGKATLADGTIAASTSNVFREFQNLIYFGVPVEQALRACTINPARAIGAADQVGSLEAGKTADLLILDEEYNLKQVIIKGKLQ